MADIDRSSFSDAKKIVERLLPDEKVRFGALTFLLDTIFYANGLKSSNWNLNLDKNGQFIRLNIGQVYCVQISKKYLLVLCMRDKLEDNAELMSLDIEYRGYWSRKKIVSSSMYDVPAGLAKVPGSVGCHIKYEHALEYLPKIRSANNSFVDYAIQNTTQRLAMKNAHSTGMINYLSEYAGKQIQKPAYMISEKEFYQERDTAERAAKKLSDIELKEKANRTSQVNRKTEVKSTKYYRNPYIVEYVKREAKGVCFDCNKSAPFIVRGTGEPYLEIHHIIPLASGGKDSIENTIALCPNCHRKRHYGQQ